MHKKIVYICLLYFLFANSFNANGQIPYTTPKYGFDSLKNIVYGVSIGHAGQLDTLIMDIYRPLNDSNCKRPLAVLIHGGSWISGYKDEPALKSLAEKLVKRGWVVANINYRLGTHKAQNYDMYALCNNNISVPCAYICDSSEVYRANYRAVQDTKGALRFLKQRHTIDSSDIDNIFLIGFSAGGFIAMHTVFSDTTTNKPIDCDSIAAAPTPSSKLNPYGCIPSNNQLLRPDLGPIEGTLNLGLYDSKVKGAASFYGGVLNQDIMRDIKDTPSIYLFHQGSDVVVNYKYGTLLGRISYECFSGSNICQPYYFYPKAHGCESVRKILTDSGYIGSNFKADIVNNYSFNNNCFSNGHSVDNMSMRSDSMISFFARRIQKDGNYPKLNCFENSIPIIPFDKLIVYPNPFDNIISVRLPDGHTESDFIVYDATGRLVASGRISEQNFDIDLQDLGNGVYTLYIKALDQRIILIKNH